MKQVSLRLNYSRQRLYRDILVGLGLAQDNERYSDSTTVIMKPEQFVDFVSQALTSNKAVFSLRSMDFRLLDSKEQSPAQADMFEGEPEQPSAERGEQAILGLLEALFGVPVVKIDVGQQCECPACTMGVTLEEALRGNLRATQMARNEPSKREVEASTEAKYDQAVIDDMHEKALAWNKKVDDATRLAFDHFYVMRKGDVTLWEAWRFLEKNEGRVMWPEFVPHVAYKDMPLRNVWAMAQRMRNLLLENMQ
ncbi:hypothetical protein Axy22_019 [Achromobacter phage vB_AxyP_19-32_Axy22]|uniref:Uncharacterized protein n=1 Tax=Achromobacter phage vB_AxyP_19-32_Axy22 TaxID=2591046 RepID=A0A514CVW6_9CAUD|nr:hypothetical protein Axy22_019 [Achromobacter phage vB_AxyP_19-32_Axy22]